MAQYLPLLLILACPLMMVFMMRGMHGGSHRGDDAAAHPRDAVLEERVHELELRLAEIEETQQPARSRTLTSA